MAASYFSKYWCVQKNDRKSIISHQIFSKLEGICEIEFWTFFIRSYFLIWRIFLEISTRPWTAKCPRSSNSKGRRPLSKACPPPLLCPTSGTHRRPQCWPPIKRWSFSAPFPLPRLPVHLRNKIFVHCRTPPPLPGCLVGPCFSSLVKIGLSPVLQTLRVHTALLERIRGSLRPGDKEMEHDWNDKIRAIFFGGCTLKSAI